MAAPDAPPRVFHVEDLLIGEGTVPSGKWEVTDRGDWSSCAEGPGHEAYVELRPANAVTDSPRIHETICQYDKTQRAALQYDRLQDLYVFPYSDPGMAPPSGFDVWESPPKEIRFSASHADKWRLACQQDGETLYWYRCRYFALCDEYLLEVTIWTGEQLAPDTLASGEIATLLQLVDERMASYLAPAE